jgi:hypothetical protein
MKKVADQDTTVPQNGLAIELSDGMRFNFTDYAEAAAWLEKEQKSFQWLIEGGAQAGAGISNLRGTYVKGFNQFRSQLNQWNESTDKAQIAEAIKNTFIRFYSNSNVLHSNHEFARIYLQPYCVQLADRRPSGPPTAILRPSVPAL